ncbi:MAG: PucR family transcriptional regulator [Actinobacteria bacterium]|nr:PucR family transcriptional regulator [Actinomycetota bacterium]
MRAAAEHERDAAAEHERDAAAEHERDAAAGGAAITVADALALPQLRRGLPEVVAGRERLARPVRWVHAGEARRMAELLTGGELVLTTGMGVGRRAAEQREFVERLARAGIAALVVELGGTLSTLPPALVEAAERAALPLVALRREVPFVAVTEAVHTAIVNRHYGVLRDAERIHARLLERMLDGGGPAEAVAELADTLGNPVYLHDGRERLLYHAAGPASRAAAIDAWHARTTLAGACGEEVSLGPGSRPGGLVALPIARPLAPVTPVALQRSAAVLALALLQVRRRTELQARERGSLLVDLVEGRIDASENARHAEAIGFGTAGRSLLPFACALEDLADAPAAVWDALVADVGRGLEAPRSPALVGAMPDRRGLLGVVALGAVDGRAELAERIAAIVRAQVARRLGAPPPTIAVGGASSWPQVGDALRGAVEAAAAARALAPAPWHDADALELDRLLWRAREADWLRGFVARTLGPLIEHDRRGRQALVATVAALSAHAGARAAAARALAVNRQTLYARIAKIERLLGVDLGDGATLLTLGVAVRAHRQLASARTICRASDREDRQSARCPPPSRPSYYDARPHALQKDLR